MLEAIRKCHPCGRCPIPWISSKVGIVPLPHPRLRPDGESKVDQRKNGALCAARAVLETQQNVVRTNVSVKSEGLQSGQHARKLQQETTHCLNSTRQTQSCLLTTRQSTVHNLVDVDSLVLLVANAIEPPVE